MFYAIELDVHICNQILLPSFLLLDDPSAKLAHVYQEKNSRHYSAVILYLHVKLFGPDADIIMIKDRLSISQFPISATANRQFGSWFGIFGGTVLGSAVW